MAAVDINSNANAVYELNHPGVTVWNRNIQSLSAKQLRKLRIDTILMSPPCQPFTRNGLQKDVNDHRSDGLLAICNNLIEQVDCLERVLVENVKGFEESESHRQLTCVLQKCGFHCQDFLLSPAHAVAIPNSRMRYFCVAQKSQPFAFQCDGILAELPSSNGRILRPLSQFIEDSDFEEDEFLVPEKELLKNCWVFDIVTPDSVSTNCFTKAYGHFARGTGSVFTRLSVDDVRSIFRTCEEKDLLQGARVELIKRLKLRYFTPREIERFMGFDKALTYPVHMTSRQKYKLLGNSLNVQIVAELIKLFD